MPSIDERAVNFVLEYERKRGWKPAGIWIPKWKHVLDLFCSALGYEKYNKGDLEYFKNLLDNAWDDIFDELEERIEVKPIDK